MRPEEAFKIANSLFPFPRFHFLAFNANFIFRIDSAPKIAQMREKDKSDNLILTAGTSEEF